MKKIDLFFVAGVAAAGLLGCGGADGEPPSISNVAITCAEDSNRSVGLVVEALAARVSDEDRDLVSVDGRINGLAVTLSDEDADQRFEWSPPESSEPLACSGDFFVELTARDSAGNTATKSNVITK